MLDDGDSESVVVLLVLVLLNNAAATKKKKQGRMRRRKMMMKQWQGQKHDYYQYARHTVERVRPPLAKGAPAF